MRLEARALPGQGDPQVLRWVLESLPSEDAMSLKVRSLGLRTELRPH